MGAISKWTTSVLTKIKAFSSKPVTTKHRGDRAEDLAFKFLKKKGLTLIDRNYRCYGGEIDLIMQDHDEIVFIEVRYRHSAQFISPVTSITPLKQRRIIQTALHYLQAHPFLTTKPCRFDVLALIQAPSHIEYEWIKQAFEDT